jgi:soluble lytic murein transglycosylase-like protein
MAFVLLALPPRMNKARIGGARRDRLTRPSRGFNNSNCRRRFALLAGALALLCILQSEIVSAGERRVENLYIVAARNADVPPDLLIAIAGAESAYHPWALNIQGRQVFCQSREEAETVLETTPTDDVDIGLMQINWRFWGRRSGVASRGELLDPRKNLELGAAILKDGLTRDGSLWYRISNYHSGGAREREHYNHLVYDAYLRYMHRKTRRGIIH